VPPAEVAQRNERVTNRDAAERLRSEMEEIEGRIADLRGRSQGRGTRPDPARPGSRGPGSAGRTTSNPPRVTGVERQIERLEGELLELEERLDELDLGDGPFGVGPQGGGAVGFTPDDPGRRDPSRRGRSASRAVAGLLAEESVDAWTHDLDVVPGAEYRYRLRLGVNNPLFGRAQLLGTEDPELLLAAERPIAFSPWSEWTEPIEVDRRSYYFVTAATDRGQLGLASASATVELYQMFYGYYRRATEAVEPGDPLQARFRLPEGLYVFDTDEMVPDEVFEFLVPEEDRQAFRQANRPNRRPGPATGRRPGIPPAGSQRAGDPVDDPRNLRDPRRINPIPVEEEEEEEPEPPAGVEPLDARLALGLEAVLLDVAPRPTDADEERLRPRTITEVFFFDPLQGVVVRRPDADTGADRYARVALSARAGETAKVRPPQPEQEP